MVTDPTSEASPKIAGSRLHVQWSIHGSLKYIIIIGPKTSHRSLRLWAKSSDRENSTRRRNLLVKIKWPPKRSLGFNKLRSYVTEIDVQNELTIWELTLTKKFIYRCDKIDIPRFIFDQLLFLTFFFSSRLFSFFKRTVATAISFPIFLCNKTDMMFAQLSSIYVGDTVCKAFYSLVKHFTP